MSVIAFKLKVSFKEFCDFSGYKTMANQFDVIILGMGVMGSATAYHLASTGKRILALEQFNLDHQLGSSHGESRIIRYAYENPIYVEMVKHAFPMWRDLEKVSGRDLMFTTGGFDFGAIDAPTLMKTYQSLTAAGIAFEWLDTAEANKRFPQFRVAPNERAIYQPDAGYLMASRCVLTQIEVARSRGAVVRTETSVTRIEVSADRVTVQTESEKYEAGSLVITAGPWAPRVLGWLGLDMPLQPTRESYVFFMPEKPELFTPERCPVFIYHDTPWYYGLPSVGGTGLKVGQHPRNEPVDPDTCKRTPDEDYIQQVSGWLQQHMPGAAGPVSDARICLYTMTPDEDFIIDRHPEYPNVVFGTGFSGHGFKFGILIGRILADLATTGSTPFDLKLFSIRRFLPTV